MLIGATAMGLHGVVRATEDLDLFIRATAANIDRLRVALKAAYADDPHIDEISADDLLGDYLMPHASCQEVEQRWAHIQPRW